MAGEWQEQIRGVAGQTIHMRHAYATTSTLPKLLTKLVNFM